MNARIYTIGHLDTTTGRRPLFRGRLGDRELIGWVESEAGPAAVGEMTSKEVRRRFGRQIRLTWPVDERIQEFGW